MAKKPISLKQKYDALKALIGDSYLDAIPEITDEELKRAIFPDVRVPLSNGRGLKIVCDSATDTINFQECEYNGPTPIGYREVVPSQLPTQGLVGKILKHFGARNFFLGDQINGWFRQNCFVYKACSMPGDDAVSCGYELKMREKSDKKLVGEMMDRFNSEEFNLDESMREFDCNKRGYGGAMMVPCFEEYVDMSQPLVDYSQLKGKTFLGWTNIEPYYASPCFRENGRSTQDPTYKFYMVPDYWNIYGALNGTNETYKIHRSWIFFRRHMITSKIYQPMYKYLGPSVPQMILERLYSAEVCANESSMLLRSKRSFVMEADVRKLVANPEYAKKFLKNCQLNSDNYGMKILPRNSNAKQMDSMLSECMPLTTAQYGILCAEVEIPAPKFMMAQLQGFANSGNYEIKLYAQNIRKLTKNELTPIVKQTVKFYTACATGKPQVCDVEFGDIDIPTVTEQAEILYEQARAMKFSEEAKSIKKGTQVPNSHKTEIEKVGK